MFKPELLTILIILVALVNCNQLGETKGKNFKAWPSSIEVRTYPGAFSRQPDRRKIELKGLRGEVVSAQVVVKDSRNITGLSSHISDLTGPGRIPAGQAIVRYGAYLPVDETMTLTADPLLEKETVDVPANVAQPVWLTLKIPADSPSGKYSGTWTVEAESGGKATFDLSLEVLPAELPPPADWSFYLNIWQDPGGVARAHNVAVWSDEHWTLLEKYAANFAAHGMKTITTSIVYDPWDSQTGYPFETMVEWKYPGRYVPGTADRFSWDFTNFDRYVNLMMAAGIREKIDCFSLVKGPGKNMKSDIRYLDTAGHRYRVAKITIGDREWYKVWSAFLPAFRKHLEEKGWFETAFLSFDEKPVKAMQLIFDLVLKVEPDFRISIAGGSHYRGDRRKSSDEISLYYDFLMDKREMDRIRPVIKRMRAARDRYITFYTACQPPLPNVFLYSPLREARLLPWLAWKYDLDGYLRWASNAFPADVWKQPNYKWHSGDMYFVYPGDDGPLDSMRWELLRQGIQDYEVLRIAWALAEKAGRKDLLKKIRQAVYQGTMVSSCHMLPMVGQARNMIDDIIRELAGN